MNPAFITGVLKRLTLASALIIVPLLPFSQPPEVKTVSAITVSPYSFMTEAPPVKIDSETPGTAVDSTIASQVFISPPVERPSSGVTAREGGVFNIQQVITNAALKYGQDPTAALRVSECESGQDPTNWFGRSRGNPLSAALANGEPLGLFQFKPATFYGNGGKDIWSPDDQADVAMRMWQHGQKYQWSCR